MHGIVSGPTPEGATRLIYDNPDDSNTRTSGNEKLEKAKELIDKLEADVVAYLEHRINSAHNDNVNGIG